jgi:hypothetical protein
VRTRFGDQAEFAKAIFEEDEIFPQQTDALGPAVLHVGQRCDRMPVTAQQISHARPGLDPGQ